MFFDLLGKQFSVRYVPFVILIEGTSVGIGKSSFAHYFRQSNEVLHQHRIIHLDQYLDDDCNGAYRINSRRLPIIQNKKVLIEGLLGKNILESIKIFPDLHIILDKSYLIGDIDEYKNLSTAEIAEKQFSALTIPEFQRQIYQYFLDIVKLGRKFELIHEAKIYKFPCPNASKSGINKNIDMDRESSDSDVSNTQIYICK